MTTPAERAQRTIDATFREQGVVATYSPPSSGEATPCVVIHAAPDIEMRMGDSRPIVAGNIIEIRKSEIDAPAQGGVIEVEDGPTLTILDDPHHASDDVFRLVWIMTAR